MSLNWKRYYWVLLALLSFAFSWNAQSFWIDECCTALCSVQPSIGGVWEQIHTIGGSDAQIAFYYYLLYFWHLITGADAELGLRLFNVCWVLLGAWFFRKEPVALVTLLISPFFMYYANELRNYILQIVAACGVGIIFYRTSMGEPIRFNVLFAALWCLCLVSLTSVGWALGFSCGFAVLAWRQFRGVAFWKSVAIWAIPFMALASYYVYTLMIGARATSIKSNVVVNAGASLYELFGISGIGPERSELRLCKSLDSVWAVDGLATAIVAGIIVFAGLCYGLYRWHKKSEKPVGPALLCLMIIPSVVFFYGASAMDFRFSGRHCAPLFPVICLAWACVWPGWKNLKQGMFGGVLFLLMMGVWVLSDCRMRFLERYGREDFRGAIHYCKEMKEQGKDVLLLCNNAGKEFYGWDENDAPADSKMREYDCIVVTRPDDYHSIIKKVETTGMYEKTPLCHAFYVYRKKVTP